MDIITQNGERYTIQATEPFGNPFNKEGKPHLTYTFEGGHPYPMFYSTSEEMCEIKDWYWGEHRCPCIPPRKRDWQFA